MKNFLEKKDRDILTALFDTLDDDHNGIIDTKDIAKGYCEKYGINVLEAELGRVSKQIDVSREGGITVTEFMMGACSKLGLVTEGNLKAVY